MAQNLVAVMTSALALALVALPAPLASAREPEPITIASPLASKGPFTAQLLRPDGPGPFPAIVALHGCSGLLNAKGEVRSREADWAQLLQAAGYVVLLADSFNARGFRQICTIKDREITEEDRADDAAAAADWLGRQPFVDKARLGLLGWSHGAQTVLWTVRPGFMTSGTRFKTAVAFYPGCRQVARLPDWQPSTPLTILMGSADDWTQPGPCRELAQRTGARFIEYPGAYHGFDTPNAPVRVRKNLAKVRGEEAHVGTDPAARAAAIREVMTIFAAALGRR